MRALSLVIALIGAPVCAEPPVVVTDIAPVHSLVSQVMGDLGAPRLLLDAASDPHHFQMRPSQGRILAEADLLIWMGPELTPWLTRTRETMAPMARSLPLLGAADAPLVIEGDDVHRADGDGHAHEAAPDSGELDPHGWLDPLNAAFYLGVIAAELATLDPANAETYDANADGAADKLLDLHAKATSRLAPLRDVTLIATHDAFGYLLARYDLALAGSLSDRAGNAAGVAGLSALQKAIADSDKPVCILQEPGVSARAITNLVASTPPKLVELDPLGRAQEPGPGLYATMFKDLVDALATCVDAEG